MPIGMNKLSRRSGTSNAIPDSGVFRYEFEDDSDTTTATDSWGDNDATINGASYDSDASVGSFSLLLDGTDDYVETPIKQDASSVSPPASFSIWYKLANNNGSTLFGNDSGNGLYFTVARDSADHLSFRTYDGSFYGISTTESGAGDTGVWHHIAGTHDGSEYVLYLDGSQIASASESTFITSNTNMQIGVRSTTARTFDGRLDDPRAYDKALSSTEVSNLYNTGSIDG